MSNKSRRLKDLEKRVAALETLVQAQQDITVPTKEMLKAVMMEMNRKTRENGKIMLF